MKSGIYEILNTLNNFRYVGSTVNLNKRFGEHKYLLRNNRHHSYKLQVAWDKYGEKHFKFKVLEYCEPIKDTLLSLEQKYLDLQPEYNVCQEARNTTGVVFSEERKRKIGLANSRRIIKEETRIKHSLNSLNSEWNAIQRKAVIMLDLQDRLIKEFNSICEAAIYTGHINHRVQIKRVLGSETRTAYSYKWRLKN